MPQNKYPQSPEKHEPTSHKAAPAAPDTAGQGILPHMPQGMQCAVVPAHMHGQRLDAALALFLPESGIRLRRRLFDTHTILVNGSPAAKGRCVREGETLLLVPRDNDATGNGITQLSATDTSAAACETDPALAARVHIIHRHAGYAAVFKPGGMHSAHIAGGPANSLESLIAGLFPEQEDSGDTAPTLINRLDRLTSGMVMVAFGPSKAEAFHTLEDAGAVEKLYLAVVHGDLKSPLSIQTALDTAKRRTTRALATPAEDPLRHTTILPLGSVTVDGEQASCTLVLASIHKGARHQIRAHLAHAGYPIVGDPIYGPQMNETSQHPLYLHHYHIEFGKFSATCPPPQEWNQWQQWLSQGLALPHNA
ncbi:MAG: pseudouridine synthase family protein [Halodesulfovibrio sp.]